MENYPMDESLRQFAGALYIAACEAVGPTTLDRANETLEGAVKSGAVSDPMACRAILTLIGACKVPPQTAELANAAEAIADATGNGLLRDLAAALPPGTINRQRISWIKQNF
jgi:hypothetical protein